MYLGWETFCDDFSFGNILTNYKRTRASRTTKWDSEISSQLFVFCYIIQLMLHTFPRNAIVKFEIAMFNQMYLK